MESPPVQYVTTTDGFNIAYLTSGQGMPLVFMHPLGHVQLDWQSPATGPWLRGLSERTRLVQYDSRGQGMSTRGLRQDHAAEDYELDLDALIGCLHLERTVLFGMGFAAHTAIRYAVTRPGKLAGLVLLHSALKADALTVMLNLDLARENWEVFLQTAIASPHWSEEQRLRTTERFRQSTTQQDWLLRQRAFLDSDIEECLTNLSLPTLVMHARGNSRARQDDSAALAALMPNARLALIEGDSALGDAASGLAAVEAFISGLDAVGNASPSLSAREVEVLRLVAGGKSNQQIADELVISLNTVRRHISNIFDKAGVGNRAEATSYAHKNRLV